MVEAKRRATVVQNYLANDAYLIHVIDLTCNLKRKHFTRVFLGRVQNQVVKSFLLSH